MKTFTLFCAPLLCTAACLAGCAAEESGACMSPAGNYKIELVPSNGSCSDSFNAAFAANFLTTKAKASEQCAVKTGSEVDKISVDNVVCDRTMSISTAATSSGYTGTMSVAVTCDDGSSCQEAFSIKYTKQ